MMNGRPLAIDSSTASWRAARPDPFESGQMRPQGAGQTILGGIMKMQKKVISDNRPTSIVGQIRKEVNFCNEVGFTDDVTILVVKCNFDGSM
jgi:hypothetical protein